MYKLMIFAIIAGLAFGTFPSGSHPKKKGPRKPGFPFPGIEKRCCYPVQTKCWTDWFDRDNPSGNGDYETLLHLRAENPCKICPNPTDIEVQTLGGQTLGETGDNIYKNDVTTGFVCRNSDQNNKKCQDYRVRFSCHPPFCGEEICWTKWYNRDDPGGTGDWELLKDLRKENPGEICENPLFIEAVTVKDMEPADTTGETFFIFNPTTGFVCKNEDQKDGKCQDYQVRFGCPCDCTDSSTAV